jgi:hypothetical protein
MALPSPKSSRPRPPFQRPGKQTRSSDLPATRHFLLLPFIKLPYALLYTPPLTLFTLSSKQAANQGAAGQGLQKTKDKSKRYPPRSSPHHPRLRVLAVQRHHPTHHNHHAATNSPRRPPHRPCLGMEVVKVVCCSIIFEKMGGFPSWGC